MSRSCPFIFMSCHGHVMSCHVTFSVISRRGHVHVIPCHVTRGNIMPCHVLCPCSRLVRPFRVPRESFTMSRLTRVRCQETLTTALTRVFDNSPCQLGFVVSRPLLRGVSRPRHVVSCRVVSCQVVSCHVKSVLRHVMSMVVMSFGFMSFFMLRQVLSWSLTRVV